MILVVGDVVDDVGVRPLEPVNPRSDTRAEIRMTPGGSAANTAAWLGFLGVDTRFVGRAGVDGPARHGAALADLGVDARIAVDPVLPTATIVLTLDADADRTMFVDRAANATLSGDDVPDDVWDDVTWLHLTGYTFFDPDTRPVALDLVAQARSRGVGTSVDPSSLGFLRECGAEAFLGWTEGVDLVVPNADEARFLIGSSGPFVDFDRLAASYPHVVVTMGSMGAVLVGDGVREQVVAPRVDVLDTTGAGDAFTAGFLAAWTQQQDPRAALAGGAGAAERCITFRGARP
ncbi:kinase, PfkB family [Aeromicrobium marinum DSM 15272]|uniref:Kinase, PfkB family n=1 Tax=Aeromicrobium marinum DSM 15272 TaxID=585531 RepID=E2SF61_9ACTN|nr:PfkB family carbohydrate kinase [Aeromicrobium marinum]EFQ82146.1 kinase, PfkB family [Aeromicrobium marinum DSM 15272]